MSGIFDLGFERPARLLEMGAKETMLLYFLGQVPVFDMSCSLRKSRVHFFFLFG